METFTHPAFSVPISRIAFGGDPLGGHNWGMVDIAEATRSVEAAVDRGVTLFDTADVYGNGLSEQRMGRALLARRNDVLIASKFGVRLDDNGRSRRDNSPAWITQAVDLSLQRLGTDHIDLYQLHWWDQVTPFAAIWECLDNLRQQGKIVRYGATNVTLSMMGLAHASQLPENFVSLSAEFSLVAPGNRSDIEAVCGSATSVAPIFLSWGSLAAGLLSGKYRSMRDLDATDRRVTRADSHFSDAVMARNLGIVDLCRTIAEEHAADVQISQVALQWIVRTLGFGCCLVGIKSTAQLESAAAAFDFALSDEQVERLNAASESIL